jgi:hypothetical protein
MNATRTEIPQYRECFQAMLRFLKARRHKLLDRDLVKAAFWLTSFGAICLADPQRSIPEEIQPHLEYIPPGELQFGAGTLERFAASSRAAPPIEEDVDDEIEMEYPYRGDDLSEEQIEDASSGSVLGSNVLEFLQKFLGAQMEEDGDLSMEQPPDAAWPPNEVRLEQFLMHFFCSEDWIARCRTAPSSIDRQVELWNYFARLAPDHRYDDIVTKVISIISIPASEASCERAFSRQKRVITHLRTRTSPELARARLAFLEVDRLLNR